MTLLLLLSAAAPAIFLVFFIRKKDRVDKEPVKLILKLLFYGMLVCIPVALIELYLIEKILDPILPETSLSYIIISNFLLIALFEELGKLGVTALFTWRSKEFNCTFDGIVYAVTAALGFALFENIVYVLDGDLSTAIARALTAVPGHAIDAVYMGVFYSSAKRAAMLGDKKKKRIEFFKALIIPVILHGSYDFGLDYVNITSSSLVVLAWLAGYITLFILTVKKVKKQSMYDAYINIPVMSSMPIMSAVPEGSAASATPAELDEPASSSAPSKPEEPEQDVYIK